MPKAKTPSSKIISIAAQKGGSGKTTIAAALAEWLLKQGQTFRLIDANPGQQTLTRWAELRQSRGIQPALEVVPAFELVPEPGRSQPRLRNRTAELLQERFAGTTIIDLPGWIDSELGPVLRYSDLLLLPMPLMVFDYLSLTEVVQLIHAARQIRKEEGRPELKVQLLINKRSRSSAQDSLKEELVRQAKLHGLGICRSEFSQLNDFFAAQMAGRSAVSYAPSGKAAQQVHALAGELGL